MDGSRGVDSATSLPRPLTSLVGRDRDIQRIRALIQPEQARLVTLTGPGGVGKTRLALQVAASMHQDFTHGAYFVSLAPVSDPDLVLPTVAQTLGVREVTGEPILRTLCSALSDKHLLLILDNFEQVISAGPQLPELLQCAPRLHLLVTSRTVLRVYGEQEYEVPPLAFPIRVPQRGDAATKESPEELARYEAVRLFVERARAIRSDFALTPSNGPVVAEICRRLDGLPLAIELAAARLKLMSPQALLKRLDRALPLLTQGATTLPARHQTLRDAIAWSYDLLGEEEKRLFRCLSVFVGGCTLEAAEALCGGEGSGVRGQGSGIQNPGALWATKIQSDPGQLLDTLAALVDKSLLRQVEGEDGEPRFLMLETIREFALDATASSGEEEAVRERHALYFLDLACIQGMRGRILLWDTLTVASAVFAAGDPMKLAVCGIPLGSGRAESELSRRVKQMLAPACGNLEQLTERESDTIASVQVHRVGDTCS